jgi:hypothetical protein
LPLGESFGSGSAVFLKSLFLAYSFSDMDVYEIAEQSLFGCDLTLSANDPSRQMTSQNQQYHRRGHDEGSAESGFSRHKTVQQRIRLVY